MSRAIDRLRTRNDAYRKGITAFDALSGDDGGGGYTTMIPGLIAELAQTGGAMAQAAQEKADKEKKAAADKAAYESSEEHGAEADAKKMRKMADDLKRKADTAQAKAGVTKKDADKKAADELQQKAALAEIDARAAEARYAAFKGGGTAPLVESRPRGGFEFPTWGKIALGAVGVLGGGLLVYKIAKK